MIWLLIREMISVNADTYHMWEWVKMHASINFNLYNNRVNQQIAFLYHWMGIESICRLFMR